MESRSWLKGKVALVTGGGRGIGRAIALRLGSAGCDVATAARNERELNETARLIEGAGGQAVVVVGDVSREDDVGRMVETVMKRFGRIDVLVNNAGVAPNAGIEAMGPSMFDEIVGTNVRAVYLCSRAVWPVMVRQGGGAIVNMASVAAYDPFPGFAAYGAAKAFVVAYTKGLAQEGIGKGIRVFGIAPGAVETRMLRGPFPDFPSDKVLAPEEVAEAVEQALAPAMRHSSGQTILIRKE